MWIKIFWKIKIYTLKFMLGALVVYAFAVVLYSAHLVSIVYSVDYQGI